MERCRIAYTITASYSPKHWDWLKFLALEASSGGLVWRPRLAAPVVIGQSIRERGRMPSQTPKNGHCKVPFSLEHIPKSLNNPK